MIVKIQRQLRRENAFVVSKTTATIHQSHLEKGHSGYSYYGEITNA